MSNDHEDLLRDGSQMPVRAATMVDDVRLVVGFRRGGQVSVYCGEDPVFQFNADGELRRVYFRGERYAADHGSLMHLQRVATPGRLQFVAAEITPELLSEIQSAWREWRSRLVEVGVKDWLLSDGDSSGFHEKLAAWLPGKSDLAIAVSAGA